MSATHFNWFIERVRTDYWLYFFLDLGLNDIVLSRNCSEIDTVTLWVGADVGKAVGIHILSA